MAEAPLLRARGVTKRYDRRHAPHGANAVDALAGVDLVLDRGATLALVGQSGSGKSTLARCLARLEAPSSGTIEFEGVDVWALRGAAVRAYHRQVQLVLQDAAAALSPRFRAAEIVSEPLAILGEGTRTERRRRALELMEIVGLPSAVADRRPAELSGGQRQRLALARALAVRPRLLILDEAFTGLDASVQAQMAGLLAALQRERELSYVLISHDLALMSVLADEVAIMLEGRIVERQAADALFASPTHVHTRALVAAVPALPPAPADPAPGPAAP